MNKSIMNILILIVCGITDSELYFNYCNAVHSGSIINSTVVLNSRDHPKNIWLLKGMHLGTQWFKIQNTKNLPQRYTYSSNNAISLFKQTKCCNICPLENFKKL